MANSTIEIIYVKEMRSFINIIKNFGLSSKGIIFGGLVRDEIIGCHYRKEFYKNGCDKDKYWNEDYDPQTIKRLILPNDMDIYFKTTANANDFINKIKKYIELYFKGRVVISSVTDRRNLNQLLYIDNALVLNHLKIMVEIVIGKTIKTSGSKLKFNIDIITVDDNLYYHETDYKNCIDNIEPPFNCLDFLSNSFIMEKTNGRSLIRLSNSTGTPIDNMGYIEKAAITVNIMNDIINHKTLFTRNIVSFNAEPINCFRILKMINRNNFSWTITNLPFKIFKINEISKSIDEICCICRDDIKIEISDKKDEKIVELNTNKNKTNIIHFNCFITYLEVEQRNRYISSITNKLECRCPFRNPFNFNECYKLIKYPI